MSRRVERRPCRLILILVLGSLLASCGGGERKARRGDYGPIAPEPVPADIAAIPDARWRDEPLSKYGNPRSYRVRGETYYVERVRKSYTAKGLASWYGKDFHGERTSSGERYDMYKMTAAHKTLPIPSYVRVTNLQNGRKVILRVNDRGPFIDGRIIDVSYTAAVKLGMIRRGTAYVEVEALLSPPDLQIVEPSLPPAEETPVQIATVAALPAPDGPPEVAELPPPQEPQREVHAAAVVNPPPPEPVIEAAPANSPAVTPDIGSEGIAGLFLQAGAFRSRTNAELLQNKLIGAGLAGAIRLIAGTDEMFRVRVGPYSDDEALVSDRLALEFFGLRPSLLKIE